MCKLLIFGGTAEGRELAEFCFEQGIEAFISVTTDYGAELLPRSEYIHILNGRLDEEEIAAFISDNKIRLVIDATHPYAQLATKNIKSACEKCRTEYFRLLRAEESKAYGICVRSTAEAAEYLNKCKDRALITTGSKELSVFTSVADYRERFSIRVLPADGILEYCEDLGFKRENVICAKGPFSVQENIEQIMSCHVEILVTKQSGSRGGYPEKVEAAKSCGIKMITIIRPSEIGLSIEKIKEIIMKQR